MTKILFLLQIQSSLMMSFSLKKPKKKKNTKLNVIDHVKLSVLLSAQILVAFKIIIKLDYIER